MQQLARPIYQAINGAIGIHSTQRNSFNNSQWAIGESSVEVDFRRAFIIVSLEITHAMEIAGLRKVSISMRITFAEKRLRSLHLGFWVTMPICRAIYNYRPDKLYDYPTARGRLERDERRVCASRFASRSLPFADILFLGRSFFFAPFSPLRRICPCWRSNQVVKVRNNSFSTNLLL